MSSCCSALCCCFTKNTVNLPISGPPQTVSKPRDNAPKGPEIGLALMPVQPMVQVTPSQSSNKKPLKTNNSEDSMSTSYDASDRLHDRHREEHHHRKSEREPNKQPDRRSDVHASRRENRDDFTDFPIDAEEGKQEEISSVPIDQVGSSLQIDESDEVFHTAVNATKFEEYYGVIDEKEGTFTPKNIKTHLSRLGKDLVYRKAIEKTLHKEIGLRNVELMCQKYVAETGSRYEVTRSIAESIYGEVLLAVDLLKPRPVIIKKSLKDSVRRRVSRQDIPVRENVIKEIAIQKYLAEAPKPCPHIVEHFAVSDDDHHIYHITEFIENGELFYYIVRRGDLNYPQEEINVENRRLMRQIIQGVSFMHRMHVCHRDLSCENILLDLNYNVKIADLGLCEGGPGSSYASGDWRTRPGALGKTQYMAPEVFRGRIYDGRAADIWSCGVILFILLTGNPPYRICDEGDDLFRLIIQGKITYILDQWGILDTVPDQALDLCQKMLAYEKDRLSMESILRHPYIKPD